MQDYEALIWLAIMIALMLISLLFNGTIRKNDE